MQETPTTRASLLVRLAHATDRQSWAHFVDVYAPIVYGFARGRGLQDADAADLTQTVLLRVARAMDRFDYDPERGTFRGWLFTIACNELRKFLERPGIRGTGDTDVQRLLEAQPAQAKDPLASWQEAWEHERFAWAAEQVQAGCEEKTWRAFWQTAVEGRPGKEVAAELGLSTAAVYLAKGRVMARLRDVLNQATED